MLQKFLKVFFLSYSLVFSSFAGQVREIGFDVGTLKTQATTPSNPASGKNKIYVKDGEMKLLDSGGVERGIGASSSVQELLNGDFEATAASWTISNATPSAETSNMFEGKKSLSLALTGALSLSQSSTINAARKLGVQMVASIFVKSDDVSDLQLCSLKNGAEDKCTVVGGYVQGTGWRQLTVSFLGDSTSNGLKLKSTDTTGTVLVDQAFVGVGSPIVDFAPDMVYSAKISATGGILSQNTDFIASCTNANPIVCAFKPNEFTVAPVCSAVIDHGGAGAVTVRASSISSSSVSFERFDLNAAISNGGVMVVCQKQGADYKTSKAYVASSSDTDWASCGHTTSDFTGFGTVSAIETQCKREGSDLLMRGKFTSGTSTATEVRVGLKLNGSALVAASSPVIPTIQIAGHGNLSAATANQYNVLIEPSVGYITYGIQSATNSGQTKQQGSVFISSGQTLSFFARIPIQGWQNSGVIVGSFQGYNETPGTSRVETFSVSYGETVNAICDGTGLVNTNQCAYLDQIGNAVANVTRVGLGEYTVNTVRNYSRLKCVLIMGNPVTFTTTYIISSTSNTFSFTTTNASTKIDTYGTLLCQGIPQ